MTPQAVRSVGVTIIKWVPAEAATRWYRDNGLANERSGDLESERDPLPRLSAVLECQTCHKRWLVARADSGELFSNGIERRRARVASELKKKPWAQQAQWLCPSTLYCNLNVTADRGRKATVALGRAYNSKQGEAILPQARPKDAVLLAAIKSKVAAWPRLNGPTQSEVASALHIGNATLRRVLTRNHVDWMDLKHG